MAEPNSTTTAAHIGVSISGGLAAALGPVMGTWIAVVFCACVGALWAIQEEKTETKLAAIRLLFMYAVTSVIFTGTVAYFVTEKTGLPMEYALPSAAFFISFFGNKYGPLKDAAVSRAKSLIGGTQQ